MQRRGTARPCGDARVRLSCGGPRGFSRVARRDSPGAGRNRPSDRVDWSKSRRSALMLKVSTIDNPIPNSPYKEPTRHFRFDADNQITTFIDPGRRGSSYFLPIASPKKKGAPGAVRCRGGEEGRKRPRQPHPAIGEDLARHGPAGHHPGDSRARRTLAGGGPLSRAVLLPVGGARDKRPNIPTRETAAFADDDGIGKAVYHRDRSLDPQLVWKGKDEQDAKPL